MNCCEIRNKIKRNIYLKVENEMFIYPGEGSSVCNSNMQMMLEII